MRRAEQKLSNPQFLERAPLEVIEKERRIYEKMNERIKKIQNLLTGLEDCGS